MRLSWAAATAALVLCSGIPGAASAQTIGDDNEGEEINVVVGVGVICNTPEQMQRLVSLRMDGTEVPRAVKTVNEEVKDTRACGVAAVAFQSGKMVDLKNVQGKMVQIMQISVVAAFDGQQWSLVPSMTQYALIEAEGYPV